MAKTNILFIMSDQHRYDCLGCNGNSIIKTPRLDALADESANFSSFFIQSPVCTPSRQTYFTGRYARCHKNRVNYTAMNDDVKFIQKYLQEDGYITGFVGKLHYFPPTLEYALSTGFDKGLLHDAGPNDNYSSYVKWLGENGIDGKKQAYRRCHEGVENPYVAEIDDRYHETTWCGGQTIDMLRDFAQGEKPFFLFSSYWRPHAPFELPEQWASMYQDADVPLPRAITREEMDAYAPGVRSLALRDENYNYSTVDRERLKWQIRAYYGAVSQMDYQIGRTLDELDKLGLRDNTIVVYCSDHGDFLMEHGLIDKNAFYDTAIHVPFMIRLPGIIVPGKYDDLAESTDVLATLFELCGLEVPYAEQGRSFASLVSGGGLGSVYTPREYVYAENIIPEVITCGKLTHFYEKGKGIKDIRHPDAKMVRSKRYKYNYYVDFEELFDLEADPGECNNLAYNPAYDAQKLKLKTALLDWMITADEADQIAPFWYSSRDARGGWVRLQDFEEM